MDISYLKFNFQKLIEHLEKNNYHKDAFWLTRRCVNLVLSLGPTSESYEEIFWKEVKRRGYKPNEPRFKAFMVYLGNVKRFHIEGKLPDRKAHEGLFPRKPVETELTEEFDISRKNADDFHDRQHRSYRYEDSQDKVFNGGQSE